MLNCCWRVPSSYERADPTAQWLAYIKAERIDARALLSALRPARGDAVRILFQPLRLRCA